jgi:tetratricopeptide (TPR) repeat protein
MKKNAAIVCIMLFVASSVVWAQAGSLLTVRGGINYMIQEKPIVYDPGASLDARMYFFPKEDALLQYGFTGSYLFLPTEGNDSLSVLGLGGLVSLYKPVSSRFNLRLDASTGVDGGMLNKALLGTYDSTNGTPWGIAYFAGADLFLNWYLQPDISLSADVGYKYSLGLYNGPRANLGITFHVPVTSPKLAVVQVQTATIIPAFRKYYLTHPVIRLDLANDEHFSTDNLSITILEGPQNERSAPVHIQELKSKEEATVYIPVAWKESILLQNGTTAETLNYEITYKAGGKKRTVTGSTPCVLLGHNNFVWQNAELANSETGDSELDAVFNAEDGKAAVFVNPSDEDIIALVHELQLESSKNLDYDGLNTNLRAIYQTAAYFQSRAIAYQIDPNSVQYGTEQNNTLDFLRYPAETLRSGYGDCDDLSILCASLLEAAGVPAAFITVPGHIYVAAATGMEAKALTSLFGDLSRFIEQDGIYYFPIEVTTLQKGLSTAWASGLEEWNDNHQGRALYPLEKFWNEFNSDSPKTTQDSTAWYPSNTYYKNARTMRDELSQDSLDEAKKQIAFSDADETPKDKASKYSRIAFREFTFGKLDDAFADMQHAISISPTYSNYYNAGLIAWKMGNNFDANTLLNKALALKSDGKAKTILDAIGGNTSGQNTIIASSNAAAGTSRAGDAEETLTWEEE